MLKKALLATVFAGLCSSVFAADPPPRVVPPIAPAPAYDPFVGWNLGVEVGEVWSHSDPAIGGVPNLSPSGLVWGGNLRYMSNLGYFYLGLSTSIDSASGSDAKKVGGTTVTDKNSWLGATMVQIGFVPMKDLLVYGQIGVGYGEHKARVAGKGFSLSDSERSAGLAYGAGADFALRQFGLQNWLAGVEWRHYDFGNVNYGFNVGGGVTIGTKVKTHDDAVLAKLSYKFGS